MSYNATVYSYKNGEHYGTFTAEVNADGLMLRSNSVQCTGMEGKVEYDAYIRKTQPHLEFKIVVDGCEGYRNKIMGLGLPPVYKAAVNKTKKAAPKKAAPKTTKKIGHKLKVGDVVLMRHPRTNEEVPFIVESIDKKLFRGEGGWTGRPMSKNGKPNKRYAVDSYELTDTYKTAKQG